ncbi:MAG TPA: hypothetical protein VFI47_08335, partial [Acidimicrobiales bacterium]|nr:hypothetical protein [Acidimicrobiales bacterium]
MRATPGERLVELTLCCAMTCVAGLVFADFFSGWRFAAHVVPAAAAATVVVGGACARGWRPGRT